MIQTSDSSRQYVGNNSTTTPYPVPFTFHYDEDLVVVVRYPDGWEFKQILGTDYEVTGAGDPNGGSVRMIIWALPPEMTLSISRVVPMTQLTSYEEGDSFPAKSHEKALDKLTMEIQQLARGVGTGSGDASDLGTSFRVTDASGGLKSMPKRNDSVVGVDVGGEAVLRTPSEMLQWLGQVGTAWANDSERANTRATYPGQLGVQLDNYAIYVAVSTDPGAWQPFLRFDGIVTSVDGVPGAKNNPEGDVVGTIESQVLYNKTLQTPTIIDPLGLDSDDVGLGNVDNVADADKPLSDEAKLLIDSKQSKGEKGVANGYASLDSSTKVPMEQLPEILLGGSLYKGTWNASTNTPSIPAAAPANAGWYYITAVAGTTSIDGINSWAVGDMVVSNGTVWQKLTSVSEVTSVNGKTGTVVINKADVGLDKVENYSVAEMSAMELTLTNRTIDGADNDLTVHLDSDVVGNLPVTHLNGGTGALPNTWWCGDGSWKQPAGTGDMTGPPASVEGEVALFTGTTGKLIKRATGDGLVTVASGVYQTPLPLIRLEALSPPGAIIDYCGITEPPGWLFCDGRSLLQSAYPALYANIGQYWGPGNAPAIKDIWGIETVVVNNSLTLPDVAPSGQNRLLLVWAHAYIAGDVAISSVTFNGVPLTRHIEWAHITSLAQGEFSLWYMINPPEVTADVVMTTSKNCNQKMLCAQVFNGVNQTTPLGPAKGSPLTSTNTNDLSIDVVSEPTDLVVDCLLWYEQGYYLAGSWMSHYHTHEQEEFAVIGAGDPSGNNAMRFSKKVATGTTTRMQWSRSIVQARSMIGVAIKGIGTPAFNIPDLRDYVTAGLNTNARFRGWNGGNQKLAPVIRKGNVQGDGYIRGILPPTGYPPNLSIGMRIEGPGLGPDTRVQDFYDENIISITPNAIGTVNGGMYKFFFLDDTKMGDTWGEAAHYPRTSEMEHHAHTAYDSYQYLIGQAGLAAGPHYNHYHVAYWNGTTGAGNSRMFNNIQPTMMMPKIIKY